MTLSESNKARLTAALAERYRIEGELGSGGMATVYLAEDLKHSRKVAVKILKPELAEALGHERFLREIEIVAGLTHPNILTLIDSGDADGLLFFVMPYVTGETLQARIDREGPLPVEESLRIAREVADALAYAHENGVIHRDIKPSNILFEAGHAVISDFGVARAVGAAGVTDATATGMAVGTPKYMSPEQAIGGEVDGRADIYALGCVLWEMLAGAAPFDGPTPQVILANKLSDTTPSLRTRRRSVPSEVEGVIERAMASLAADRFGTARELEQALAEPETAERMRRAAASKPGQTGWPESLSSLWLRGSLVDVRAGDTPRGPEPVRAGRASSRESDRRGRPFRRRPAPGPHRSSGFHRRFSRDFPSFHRALPRHGNDRAGDRCRTGRSGRSDLLT